uniref:Calpain catalytic domain-containing protein n=1 Tax=Acrobeloides nanus TaxID=290746 RepID=A0A914CUD3_9BILA
MRNKNLWMVATKSSGLAYKIMIPIYGMSIGRGLMVPNLHTLNGMLAILSLIPLLDILVLIWLVVTVHILIIMFIGKILIGIVQFQFHSYGIRISNAKEIMANSSKFEQIRAECISANPDFSPKDALPNASSDIKWLRPHEIVSNPEFFTDGQSRFDVVQGSIADCWLLAAVATISMCDGLFFHVVPPDQGFSKKEGYAGVFHFHFWRYGEWVEVVVDDRLPTYNKSLIFMHSKDGNEFWSALLEKAYAKIYGSYNAIQFGYTSEAIQDMSGGLTECFELDNPPPNLLEMIIRDLNKNSIFGCSYNKEMPSEVIECPEEEIKEVPLKLCEGPPGNDVKEESRSVENVKEEPRAVGKVKEESRTVENVKETFRSVENVKEESDPAKNVKEEFGPVENVKEESSPTEDVKEESSSTEDVKEESIPTENAKEESNEVTICHTESVRTDGIVMQHAYSINGVCKIKTKEKTVALLRLRNAWGKTEWNQAWSDGSKEWDLVLPEVREKIKLSFDEDGEFWMEFGDYGQILLYGCLSS